MPNPARVVCLSNVYDQHYHELRGEEIARCLTLQKRRDLFRCLEQATGRKVVVLSAPPKALRRSQGKWLQPVETLFSSHRQFFCANWDVPKLRIPLSWFFYARHVLRHTRSGDLVVIDNYEFIYIVAAWWLKLFRQMTFILDYEDGKHLIDRSWSRVLSGVAEWAGRPLIRAALLAHPAMGSRLPPRVVTEVVPGFIPQKIHAITRNPVSEVHFLYSGSLDRVRGVDLILEALQFLPREGWRLELSGDGELRESVAKMAQNSEWRGHLTYHGVLSTEANNRLMATCHVGLNCQRKSDPVSDVTFPSKVFTYLASGLLVLSSQASAVEPLCGNACFYYAEESPQSLAAAMRAVMDNFSGIRRQLDMTGVSERYSIEATTSRVRQLLQTLGVVP